MKRINNRILWEKLEELRGQFQLNEKDFAASMNLSHDKYLRLKSKKNTPSVVSVAYLVKNLGINFEKLRVESESKQLHNSEKDLSF